MANQIDLNDLENQPEDDLITWLRIQDDLYENEGESHVSDAVYDRVRKMASLMYGANLYFTGVGSDVRGGKVKLPFEMNGLPQAYEGEIGKWVDRDYLKNASFCVSDKLDGTSALVIYDPEGNLQIAYSRGNSVEAADITRHIKQIKNIPNSIPATGKTFPVRMEIIMKISDWDEIQERFTRSGGNQYKNIRNATAGLMNSSSNDVGVYDFLRGIAYTQVEAKGTKSDQIDQLADMGFETARYATFDRDDLTDEKLAEYLTNQRASSEYDIDGVVIDVNDVDVRELTVQHGDFTTQKYKVADASNYAIATVIDVPYRASKDGYLKPRINIQPVELVGVTVSFANGFNAKFIKDQQIGPGAKVRITRSGDVIPYVLGTEEPSLVSGLPDASEHGEWEWSENEVDAILTDIANRPDVQMRRLIDIFTKLQIDHLKAGNIKKLYDAGYTNEVDIICAEYTDMYMILGDNGIKVYESIEARLRPTDGIYWPTLVGSLNLLGRGIGTRKMAELYELLNGDTELMRDPALIATFPGFDITSAAKISDNMTRVDAFIAKVGNNVHIRQYTAPTAPTGTKLLGKSVVITGFRDPVFEDKIKEEGGTIKTSVSSKLDYVVSKDPNSSSGKVKKARAVNSAGGNITILGLRDFEKILYS